MSIVDDKAAARRLWEEIFPVCDDAGVASVVAANSVDHGRRPGEADGLEAALKAMHWLATVFTDQRWEIHRVIGEGDLVVVHCTYHGRHTGELMGIAPTGREVAYDYVHILRFEDGKAVERWSVRDDMTLMRQLGVLPGRLPEPAVAAG